MNKLDKLAADVVNTYMSGQGDDLGDKVIALSNFLSGTKPKLLKDYKKFTIEVSWRMKTNITVQAETLDEAKELACEKVSETRSKIPSEYVCGSLKAEG